MEGTLLVLLCLLSFIVGFLGVALYVSWLQASSLRKQWGTRAPQWPSLGCTKVLLLKESCPSAVQYNSSLTKVPEIDEELAKVLELIMRDYFEKWYHHHISPDPVCVHHAQDIITHVIAEVTTQCEQVDYLTFFIETIMEDFMEHLKCYKAAHFKVCSNEGEGQLITQAKGTLIEEAYFDEEDSNGPWRAVCCSQQSKQVYFQRVTELLLCLLLPPEDFSNPALQVLLTDLGVWQIWTPLLHTLTKPDSFNHAIVTMCKESYLTPESFSSAIGDGSTELELRTLQFKIQEEIRKLQKTGITDLDREKLNGLEAIKENAVQLINGEVRSRPENTTSLLSFNVSVPSYIITHEGSTKHCEFVLDVCCRHSQASEEEAAVVEHWTIHRRYRDFQDTNLTLRNQVEDFPVSLTLPALPAFNKLDPQRLETRRQSLDKYISTITEDSFLKQHPQAFSHIVKFLTVGEFIRSSNELTRIVDSLFNKPLSSIKSLKFPIRKAPSFVSSTSTATAATLVSSTAAPSATAPAASVATSGSGLNPSPIPSNISSSSRSSPNFGRKPSEAKLNPAEEDEDSLPVDIMLVLLEELFDFSDKKWLRRQLPSILKQLAGGKITRKVVQTTDWLISSEQVALYIHELASTMWPGGIPKQPHPSETNNVKAMRSLLARAKLIGCIPDELKMLIGNESTVKGMVRLFGLFQSQTLNCCLALRLLEGLLDTLFPSRNIKDTLRDLRTQISSDTL